MEVVSDTDSDGQADSHSDCSAAGSVVDADLVASQVTGRDSADDMEVSDMD